MKYVKKNIYALLLFVSLIAIDQLTKYLAYTNLKGSDPVNLIKDVLQLTYLQNDGAAWGLFSGKFSMFYVLTIAIVILVIILFQRIPFTKRYLLLDLSLIMLIGGAVGNFIDRVRNQYVIDFIYFKLIDFPVFNLADCFICISMGLLAILILFVYKEDEITGFFKKKNNKKVSENE